MSILSRSIIQDSPLIQDSDIIDYTLDATGDSLKYSSSPFTLRNMYKLLFSIPKIIGEKNRRKSTTKFNGNDIVLTGTITSSGVSVTGSGTAFLSELEVGDWIVGTGLEFREVSAIISDTSLTLSNAFTSDILIGQSYSRMQFFTERMDRIERHMKMIGEPFPVLDSITGSVVPDEKYFIKLSKDLTSSGLYNENKLTGQSSVDSNQQRYYTAIVNDSDSPMYLQTVKLSNSVYDISSGSEVLAPCFYGGGDTVAFMHNRFQGHYHNAALGYIWTGEVSGNPAAIGSAPELPYRLNDVFAAKTDGTNGTPRVDKFTIPNTITAPYYMRIK